MNCLGPFADHFVQFAFSYLLSGRAYKSNLCPIPTTCVPSLFDYWARYQDVLAADMDPLYHFNVRLKKQQPVLLIILCRIMESMKVEGGMWMYALGTQCMYKMHVIVLLLKFATKHPIQVLV